MISWTVSNWHLLTSPKLAGKNLSARHPTLVMTHSFSTCQANKKQFPLWPSPFSGTQFHCLNFCKQFVQKTEPNLHPKNGTWLGKRWTFHRGLVQAVNLSEPPGSWHVAMAVAVDQKGLNPQKNDGLEPNLWIFLLIFPHFFGSTVRHSCENVLCENGFGSLLFGFMAFKILYNRENFRFPRIVQSRQCPLFSFKKLTVTEKWRWRTFCCGTFQGTEISLRSTSFSVFWWMATCLKHPEAVGTSENTLDTKTNGNKKNTLVLSSTPKHPNCFSRLPWYLATPSPPPPCHRTKSKPPLAFFSHQLTRQAILKKVPENAW